MIPITHINSATGNKVITKTISAQTAKIFPKRFFKMVFFSCDYIFQSTGILCCFISDSFAFEKCWHPKNPLLALNGDG